MALVLHFKIAVMDGIVNSPFPMALLIYLKPPCASCWGLIKGLAGGPGDITKI